MKLKNLILTALFSISLNSFSQELENILKIDGKTYQIETEDKKALTLTKDRYDNWNLLATIKSDGKSIAFNIATNQEKLASGEYPLMSRVKRVDAGKVAFSVNIIDEKAGAMAYLSMKQFTSTDKGKAIVKNENGIYSITLIGVDAINMKASHFVLDANIILDPNASKTRKERNKDNAIMSMSNAWINETTYFINQANKLSTFCEMFKEEKSSEKRELIDKSITNMIDSNEEIIKILSRTNDSSLSDNEIKSYKEIASKKAEELKKFKKEINNSKITESMELFLQELGKGKTRG